MATQAQVQAFTAAVNKAIDQFTAKDAKVFLNKISIEAFTRLVYRSPVDTSRFRSSWRVGVNSRPSGETGDVDHIIPPDVPINTALPELLSSKIGDVVYMVDNVPYAEELEHGKSSQAPGPHAIVGRTINELLTQFRPASTP